MISSEARKVDPPQLRLSSARKPLLAHPGGRVDQLYAGARRREPGTAGGSRRSAAKVYAAAELQHGHRRQDSQVHQAVFQVGLIMFGSISITKLFPHSIWLPLYVRLSCRIDCIEGSFGRVLDARLRGRTSQHDRLLILIDSHTYSHSRFVCPLTAVACALTSLLDLFSILIMIL